MTTSAMAAKCSPDIIYLDGAEGAAPEPAPHIAGRRRPGSR